MPSVCSFKMSHPFHQHFGLEDACRISTPQPGTVNPQFPGQASYGAWGPKISDSDAGLYAVSKRALNVPSGSATPTVAIGPCISPCVYPITCVHYRIYPVDPVGSSVCPPDILRRNTNHATSYTWPLGKMPFHQQRGGRGTPPLTYIVLLL
jgi:hypothetical protein